ncbi:MAG: transcription antitermination factor NusB [Alphaproteobacteria bacterium]|nr:transcription antitermination factor NusB [Alphaproteobacteria bacterium]
MTVPIIPPGAAAAPQSRRSGRSAARLAAVQALYQMELSGADVDTVILEFMSERFGHEIDGEEYLAADQKMFAELVRGVVSRQLEIDPLVARTVSQDWALPRLDATLRALIRTATFELMARTDIPVKVVLSEYIDIAHAFFSGDESGFANGVLDKVARIVRPQSFGSHEPQR